MIAADAAHDSLDDMVQAVDEAATNVITHGYRGTAGWIEVDVEVDDGRCVVTMSDAAPAFDATGVPSRTCRSRRWTASPAVWAST